MNGWSVMLVLALLALGVAYVMNEQLKPTEGEVCDASAQGEIHFYSIGKIIECNGSVWVVKPGVKF